MDNILDDLGNYLDKEVFEDVKEGVRLLDMSISQREGALAFLSHPFANTHSHTN